MTFDKLRLSIFEAYQNEEISRETCENMLESVTDMEGNHIVAEGEAIRADFMGVALECANGNVEFAAFEKQAETFGDKVKAVWEKFKKWVKGIVDAIKKKICPKKKVSVSEQFMAFVDKCISIANGIAANADAVTIVKAIGGALATAGGIFTGKKLVTMGADRVHDKIISAINGVGKIIDWVLNKLPKGVQESGLMQKLREITAKLQSEDKKIFANPESYKKTQDEAGQPEVHTQDESETTPGHRQDLVDLGVAQDDIPEKDRFAVAMIKRLKNQHTNESAKTGTDGDIINESSDEDFDLDAMLADLDI